MRIRVLWVCLLFGLGLATQRMHAQFDMEESHTTASLRGIAVAGPGIAWASGSGGTVRRTEDGGYLWQICTTPPDAEKLDFRAIQAFDANTAFVMSSGKGHLSRVYKTFLRRDDLDRAADRDHSGRSRRRQLCRLCYL
jgi:photosystem II stability/assembly factor-like uncharacterized protein